MVSCHVERPLDTAVWDRYRDLCIARPGGLPDRLAAAAAGRRRGRGAVRRARPRGDGARAVRAPHALDVADARAPDRRRPGRAGAARGALAARARARAALLLRRRLVHRCGSDGRRRRPRVRRLHRDAGAAVVPAAGLAARRARRARLDPPRRRPPRPRAAEHALARRGGARARGRPAARRSTSTSTTTSCSTASGARRSSVALRLLARRRRPVEPGEVEAEREVTWADVCAD